MRNSKFKFSIFPPLANNGSKIFQSFRSFMPRQEAEEESKREKSEHFQFRFWLFIFHTRNTQRERQQQQVIPAGVFALLRAVFESSYVIRANAFSRCQFSMRARRLLMGRMRLSGVPSQDISRSTVDNGVYTMMMMIFTRKERATNADGKKATSITRNCLPSITLRQ